MKFQFWRKQKKEDPITRKCDKCGKLLLELGFFHIYRSPTKVRGHDWITMFYCSYECTLEHFKTWRFPDNKLEFEL